MKKNLKLTVTFLSLLFISNVKAEWKKDSVTLLPYSNKICIVNSKVRFALSSPYIYKTEDAGKTWQKDSLGIDKTKINWISYQDIIFLNDHLGYIQSNIEDSVYVFKTTDAGSHWIRQSLENVSSSERIKFISEYNWLSDNGRAIRVTVNGGSSWQATNKVGNDSLICNVELIDNQLFVFTSDSGSTVGLYQSNDLGNSWQKLGTLHLFVDEGFNFPQAHLVGISKTSRGLTVLYNIFYAGCGAYYDHSMIFCLEKIYFKGWTVVQSANCRFKSQPSCMFYKNDTGYITTITDIYKSTDVNQGWFRTFTAESYKDWYIQGIVYIDNVLYAYTGNGTMFRNAQPALDKNLAAESIEISKINIVAFPNPAADKITLRISDMDLSEAKLTISDMNGRTIYEQTCSQSNDIIINTNLLSNGIYTCTLTNNTKLIYGKFEISH